MNSTVITVPEHLWATARTALADAGLYLTQVPGGLTQQPRYVTTFVPDGDRVVPATTGLSPAELRVLALLCQGMTNSTIAKALYVTEDTVKTHNRRMFRKLGAKDRAHAVHLAHRAGVLT